MLYTYIQKQSTELGNGAQLVKINIIHLTVTVMSFKISDRWKAMKLKNYFRCNMWRPFKANMTHKMVSKYNMATLLWGPTTLTIWACITLLHCIELGTSLGWPKNTHSIALEISLFTMQDIWWWSHHFDMHITYFDTQYSTWICIRIFRLANRLFQNNWIF